MLGKCCFSFLKEVFIFPTFWVDSFRIFFFPFYFKDTAQLCSELSGFLGMWFVAINFRKILTISSDNSYVLFLLQLQLC